MQSYQGAYNNQASNNQGSNHLQINHSSSQISQNNRSDSLSSPQKSTTKIFPQPGGKHPVLTGQLLKRGNIFKRYQKKYIFTFQDNKLRVEKVGKDHTYEIDVRDSVVTRDKKSKRVFKIKCAQTKLTLKAADEMERELWFQNLTRIAKTYDGEDVSKRLAEGFDETSIKKIVKNVKTVKTVTLNQISDILQKQDTKLQSTLGESSRTYLTFVRDLKQLEQELTNKNHKDRMQRILDAAKAYQDQYHKAFEFMNSTNKNLHRILEEIAEKEIERNPIEFIKKEAFLHRGNEEFFSFDDDNLIIDDIYEVDDDGDNEYHEEENAVGARYTQYLNKAAFGLQEQESIDNGQQQQQPRVYEENKKNSTAQILEQDNQLVQELEDVFHDAKDYITDSALRINTRQSAMKFGNSQDNSLLLINGQYNSNQEESKYGLQPGEIPDPEERDLLPYFKDPKLKISIWTIIKDSIGKDVTKMSVPVYFNDPTNILQKCAASMEYNHILDMAIDQQDPIRRLAFIAVYSTTLLTCLEKNTTKPFNPMLGETYELVTHNFKFIAEQVSHHPPITAFECQGNKGYKLFGNNRAKTKFNGKSLNLIPYYKIYVELPQYNEKYEIQQPTVSAHNLIIGNLYLDLGGKSVIRNCSNGDYCQLEYHKRGWSSSNSFKVDGEVYSKKKELLYKVEGKWNQTVGIINAKNGVKEAVFIKNPYPEKEAFMYGFSHFMLQVNYLPNFLRNQLPPTDTRWRPDQRALENGDMKTAAYEKNRLEEKQRVVRRYREKFNIEHKPVYFEEWKNTEDDMMYFRYNGTYFEQDRITKDWRRLPDLYGEDVPPEVKQFEKKSK
eukprot:403345039